MDIKIIIALCFCFQSSLAYAQVPQQADDKAYSSSDYDSEIARLKDDLVKMRAGTYVPPVSETAPPMITPNTAAETPPLTVIAQAGNPIGFDGYFAQVGAYSVRGNVDKSWADVSGKLPKTLTHYSAISKPKEKDGRTLYLLQIGPFKKQEAWRVCRAIGNDCYAVRS